MERVIHLLFCLLWDLNEWFEKCRRRSYKHFVFLIRINSWTESRTLAMAYNQTEVQLTCGYQWMAVIKWMELVSWNKASIGRSRLSEGRRHYHFIIFAIKWKLRQSHAVAEWRTKKYWKVSSKCKGGGGGGGGCYWFPWKKLAYSPTIENSYVPCSIDHSNHVAKELTQQRGTVTTSLVPVPLKIWP